MARSVRITVSVALSVASIALAAGCSSGTTTAPPVAPAPAPTESPEASLVEQRCTMCHSTERIYSAEYDAGTWASTIERMETNGLVISGDDKQAIIDYLAGRSAQ